MNKDEITRLDRILRSAKAAWHTYLASREYDVIGHRSIKNAFREFRYERKVVKDLASLVKRVQEQSGFGSVTDLTSIQVGDVIAYTEQGSPTTFLGIVTDRRSPLGLVDTYSLFVLSKMNPDSGETMQTSARHIVAVPYSIYDKGQVIVDADWNAPVLERAVKLPHSRLKDVPRDVMEKVDFEPPLKRAILEAIYR